MDDKVLLISVPAVSVEQKEIEIEYWKWHFALKTKLVYSNLKESQLKKLGNVENQNIGLLSIASYLRENGINVKYLAPSLEYIGENREDDFLDVILKEVEVFSPDYVGLSTTTCNVPIAFDFLKKIKELKPDIKTVVGGSHANGTDGETLDELMEQFDFVIRGWGEIPFLHIINGNYESEGICTRMNGQTVVNPRNKTVVDGYPKSALDLFNIDELPGARVFTSLGCRQGKKCIFCADINNGALLEREESIILNEILYLYHNKNTRYFYLGDENFFQNKKRAVKIVDAIAKLNLDIVIGLQSRIENIDESCLKMLHETGLCTEIQYGIESASQKILNISRKGLRVGRIKGTLELTKKYNIHTLGYFLVGLPGETKETAEMTLHMIEEFMTDNILDFAEYRCVVPFPIADMWENRDTYGVKINTNDWSKYRAENPPVFDLDTLTSSEIYQIYMEGLARIVHQYRKRYTMEFGEAMVNPNFLTEVTEAGF